MEWIERSPTHWPLGDVAVILELYVSNSLYRIVDLALTDFALNWMPQNLTNEKSTLVHKRGIIVYVNFSMIVYK